jgi:hypothetical protein
MYTQVSTKGTHPRWASAGARGTCPASTAAWRHRSMPSNRFTGSVPASISALTALMHLYVPHLPRPPLAEQSALEYAWPACACACTFVHASLDARALSGRPIIGGRPIRSLGNNPFAAATFPAGIMALTRLKSLYARAVRAAQCVMGLRRMRRSGTSENATSLAACPRQSPC